VIYHHKKCGRDSVLDPDQRPRCLHCDRERSAARRAANPTAQRARVIRSQTQKRLERLVTTGKISIDTAVEMGYTLPTMPKGLKT